MAVWTIASGNGFVLPYGRGVYMSSSLRARRARRLLTLVLLIVVGLTVFAYFNGTSWGGARADNLPPNGTVDTVKERGAKLGEQVAVATEKATARVQETLSETATTAKIKAKLALDDSARARDIDVTTHGPVVTLDGSVRSVAEHDRALALAR